MTQHVLSLGGSVRIGSHFVVDLLAHTTVDIAIAGRNFHIRQFDLSNAAL